MTMTKCESSPLVSVIISSYNHAPYIEACIESVLAQSYPSIELLVVDDGSHDGSVEKLRALQRRHGFDFREQENKGLAPTLNDCIARSRGSLIAPFGSDDVMLPQRIEKQVAYLQGKPEVGICAGGIIHVDASGEPLTRRDKRREFRRLDFDDIFLANKDGAPAPTLLFRREALELVGGFDPNVKLEDLLIELKITRAGYFIDVLPDVLAYYRVHQTNTYKNRRFMIEAVLATYDHFRDHPAHPLVCARFRNSMLLKCAVDDKSLAKELLAQLPLRHWNAKTLRAIGRLAFSRPRRRI
ncbi:MULTISPECIES: glycosyltransferase family 2 protein [Pseudomonas]|uniref:glycosyltransferase family 2 protein n=1 Tax=Pseudomonas TaxID=286 RepID=UPI000DA957A2|nr:MULTISPECIES: glycosyltransferase [Pseudomonas]MDW3712632.1 glycosyltransferase [Pseudomonas sp. 2023EL-01195]PZE14779.1 glycosyltransferase family 2 protein [Pseudomonas sp. 57B-090624]